MKTEYINSKEYKRILDYITRNMDILEFEKMKINIAKEFEGNDYIYINNTLKKVKLYEENDNKKIKIIDIKILKNEIEGVIKNDDK